MTPDGNYVNRSETMLTVVNEFYSKLYSSEEICTSSMNIILNTDLFEVLTYSLKKSHLGHSMNTALIRLIYKNVGSKFDLKNWRPISLLCVDYKILAKTLTNRLKI